MQETLLDRLKRHFEEKYLDGDEVQLGQLISSIEVMEIIAHTLKEAGEEVKKYLSEEHIHYSSEPEDNWQLELEKHFEALLTKN
jgi:hypothetical protein